MKTFRSSLTALFLLTFSSFLTAQTPYQTKTFTDTNLKSIVMDVSGSDISIESWDQNSVKVDFFLESKSQSFMDSFNDKYETNYSMEDGVVYVDLKRRSKWNFMSFNNKKMYYTVKVPKSFTLDLRTSGGDLSITDLIGTIEGKTSGGDIKIVDFKGIVDVSTSGGDMDFTNVTGKIDASTSGGDINVQKCEGNLAFKTSGGDIDIKSADGKIFAETSGGDIELNVPKNAEDIDLETTGGDINIRIPKSDLTIELNSFGGDVKLSRDVDDDFKGKIKTSKVNGKLNKGGNLLNAKTTGGDIFLGYQ